MFSLTRRNAGFLLLQQFEIRLLEMEHFQFQIYSSQLESAHFQRASRTRSASELNYQHSVMNPLNKLERHSRRLCKTVSQSSKSFLSACVPNLQRDFGTLYVCNFGKEIDANCLHIIPREFLIAIPIDKRAFANTRIAKKNNFEDRIRSIRHT